MRIIYTIFASIFICNFTGFSQTDWKVKLSSGTPNIVVSDDEDNVYIAGAIQTIVDFDPSANVSTLTPLLLLNGSYASSVYIAKYNSSGSFIWAKGINATNPNDYQFSSGLNYVSDMKIDGSGNLYLTGSFFKSVDFNPDIAENVVNGQNDDSYLLKLNSDGQFIWVKTWGAEPYILNATADGGSALAVSDSTVYVAGVFSFPTDFDPGSGSVILNAFETDTYLSKFDTSGNFIWVKSWGNTGSNTYPNCIAIQSNGNVILGGSFSGTIDFDNSANTYNLTSGYFINWPNAFIVKSNFDGAFVDAKIFTSNRYSYLYQLEINENDEIVLSGQFSGITDFDPDTSSAIVEGDPSLSGIQLRSYLCKLNPDLTLQWINTETDYLGNFTYLDMDLKNEEILLTGFRNPTSQNSPDEKSVISKFNTIGENIGHYNYNETGVRAKAISSAVLDNNTLYVLGFFVGGIDFAIGQAIDTLQSSGTARRTFLAKLNLNDNSVSILPTAEQRDFIIYPNPTDEVTTIKFPTSTKRIQVRNATGQLIMDKPIIDFQQTSISLLSNGVYFISLLNDKEVFTKKLIVTK